MVLAATRTGTAAAPRGTPPRSSDVEISKSGSSSRQPQLLARQPLGRDRLASARACVASRRILRLIGSSSTCRRLRRRRRRHRRAAELDLVARRRRPLAPPSVGRSSPLQQVPSAPRGAGGKCARPRRALERQTICRSNPSMRPTSSPAARLRLGDLLAELSAPSAVELRRLQPRARSRRTARCSSRLDRLDLVLEAQERALDLFDRVAPRPSSA